MNDLQITYLEQIIGYVVHTEDINSAIQYVIKTEGMNSVTYIGIPLFQFGFNSYRYSEGDRVYCLKYKHESRVYILGRINDNKVAITNGNPLPRPGEMVFNSGDAQNSGITGLGKSDRLTIFSGKNQDTTINLSPFNFLLKSNKSNFLLEGTKFSINLNSINSFNITDGIATLKAERGIKLYGGIGDFLTTGETFGFYQSDSIPGLKKSTEGKQIIPDPKVDYSIYISPTSQYFNGGKGLFNYSESLSVKTAGITTGKDAMSFQILKGNFQANINEGSFKFNILQPLGNSFSCKIGPSAAPLSVFQMNSSTIFFEVGTLLPNCIEINTSSIILTSQNIFGQKSDIKLDGNVEITGTLIVKEKIYGMDEVYAKATKFGPLIGTGLATGLSTHEHPTAIPGPPSPPTIGT